MGFSNFKTTNIPDPSEGHRYKLDDMYSILGIPSDEFVDMASGLHGYSKQRACGNITILYAGSPDMGIHVEMSGQGCRQFECYYALGWQQFFANVIEYQAKFTRLDLAIDDIRFSVILPPSPLIN